MLLSLLLVPRLHGTPAPSPVRHYVLESISIQGSDRISVETLRRDLGLYEGLHLNDDVVMDTRQQLLGLGLFRSVLLFMKKGSAPGQARLVVDLEDDPTVLGTWAMGGHVRITHGEPDNQTTLNPQNPPLGYQVGLVSRNVFRERHRASALVDMDSKGIIREGHLAWGMPRFARESVQFDARLKVVDVSHRYLEAMAFGARGEAFWSQDMDEATLQYGVAMYLNEKPRFAFPSLPGTIAGPRIGYVRETRLLGFFPSSGLHYSGSFLLPPGATEDAVLELSGAGTLDLDRRAMFTLGGRLLTVGGSGLSSRLEGRVDVPLIRPGSDGDMAGLYIRFRAGSDRYEDADLVGSSATFGLRYHSSGFIAELALKVTRMPADIAPFLPAKGEP